MQSLYKNNSSIAIILSGKGMLGAAAQNKKLNDRRQIMKECKLSLDQDRRIKSRHAAPCLGVSLRTAGVLNLFRSPVEVKCVDINRYGMAIECDTLFREGEKVVLDFKGKYICKSNIKAVVSSATHVDDTYRYGLTFCYCLDSKLYSREEDNALSRIESIYNSQYQEKAQKA